MAETQVIALPERFDFSYHKAFLKQYQGLLDDNSAKKIILDFSRVTYLDSSALGMMVLLRKRTKATGISAIIRGAHGTAEDILRMANFQQLYDIE